MFISISQLGNIFILELPVRNKYLIFGSSQVYSKLAKGPLKLSPIHKKFLKIRRQQEAALANYHAKPCIS